MTGWGKHLVTFSVFFSFLPFSSFNFSFILVVGKSLLCVQSLFQDAIVEVVCVYELLKLMFNLKCKDY